MNGKATLLALLLAARAAAASESHVDFDVFLDTRPIGTHRFDIQAAADGSQTIHSVAAFDVKVLGLLAYRYRHEATEHWAQGCLVQVSASTNDNGKELRVTGDMRGGRFTLQQPGAASRAGCVSSYAYWDPASLIRQHELLNPQTGEFDLVQIRLLGEETLVSRGAKVLADGYRLGNGKIVIDLWYSKSAEWLQLDITTATKRRLHYRLAGIATTNSAPSGVSTSDRSPP